MQFFHWIVKCRFFMELTCECLARISVKNNVFVFNCFVIKLRAAFDL